MTDSKNRDAAIIAEKEILQKVTLAMRSAAGPKRWFWELLQNAVDTISDEPDRRVNVIVTLVGNDDGKGAIMQFEHDGTAFLESNNPNKFDDFKNLILPRSGKLTSDLNKVGKFGTGFLSTHNLSLKIDVEGAFQTINGEVFAIETTLDRTYFIDEDDQYDSNRIDSIIDGLDRYDQSLEDRLPTDNSKTRFIYHLNDENAVEKVRTGLRDIEKSLPIVFILNSKIGSLHIQNRLDNENYSFTSDSPKAWGGFHIQNCIKVSSSGDSVFSIAYKQSDSVTLCWPVEPWESGPVRFRNASKEYKDLVKDKMPLIYSTFPMIGSHGIKFPVVVHSGLFKPNEKRDGVSLTNETYTKEDLGEKIELDKINKSLFEKAVRVYEDFVSSAAADAENLFYILKVNGTPDGDWISNTWFEDKISRELTRIVSTLPVIDVSDNKEDRKAILDENGEIQVFFPSVNIGGTGDEKPRLNTTFYKLISSLYFSHIPVEKDLEHWHKILWKEDHVIKILEVEDLLENISASYGSLKLLSAKLGMTKSGTLDWLNVLYRLIDETDNNDLYDDFAVIPDQKGDFKLGVDLKLEDPESMIDPQIICILRILDPKEDWFALLVHRGINSCNYPFEKYTLKENASNKINDLLLPNDYRELLSRPSTLKVLQRLLSFYSENETGSNIKKQVFSYSQDIFGKRPDRKNPFFKDFKTENVIKHMIRLINSKIEESKDISGLMSVLKKDKVDTIIWLNEFLNFQIRKDFDRLIHWANIVPNQYEVFCAHGEENDASRMYMPYEIVNGRIHNELSDELIKNLVLFNPSQDWKFFLVLNGIELKTLPVKSWFELGAAIDKCIYDILQRILNDSEEQKQVYKKNLLEVIEWWEYNKSKAEYFKILPANADRLYSLITFSRDFVDILRNKEKFELAKKISKSNLSADTIEKTLDKIEEMQNKFGHNVVEEFLHKAETFIQTKEVFNGRLLIGQNIEELFRQALEKEGIDIIPDKSEAGSYDITLYHKDRPEYPLKLEVKSYKHNSSADFSFSPSQIIESNYDAPNYIVCTLERPADENASIEYLKTNLAIQKNLSGLTIGFYDKIEAFHSIYNDSKSGKIPLEIPCVTDPRVRIDQQLLLQNTGNYDLLIQVIKDRLLPNV